MNVYKKYQCYFCGEWFDAHKLELKLEMVGLKRVVYFKNWTCLIRWAKGEKTFENKKSQ